MSAARPLGAEEVEHTLRDLIAKRLRIDPAELHSDAEFADLGLESIHAVRLSVDIQDRFGLKLPPTLLWEYPSFGSLVRHVVEQLEA